MLGLLCLRRKGICDENNVGKDTKGFLGEESRYRTAIKVLEFKPIK